VLYSLLLRDSLAFRVNVPESVRAGEPVRMALRLTNRTERVLTLSLQKEHAIELTATHADGTVVWRHVQAAANVSDIPAQRVLEPAESLTLETSWDGRVGGGPAAPGRYLVIGTLFVEGEESLATPPVQFELLANRSG
jgi:hypothetical protein